MQFHLLNPRTEAQWDLGIQYYSLRSTYDQPLRASEVGGRCITFQPHSQVPWLLCLWAVPSLCHMIVQLLCAWGVCQKIFPGQMGVKAASSLGRGDTFQAGDRVWESREHLLLSLGTVLCVLTGCPGSPLCPHILFPQWVLVRSCSARACSGIHHPCSGPQVRQEPAGPASTFQSHFCPLSAFLLPVQPDLLAVPPAPRHSPASGPLAVRFAWSTLYPDICLANVLGTFSLAHPTALFNTTESLPLQPTLRTHVSDCFLSFPYLQSCNIQAVYSSILLLFVSHCQFCSPTSWALSSLPCFGSGGAWCVHLGLLHLLSSNKIDKWQHSSADIQHSFVHFMYFCFCPYYLVYSVFLRFILF